MDAQSAASNLYGNIEQVISPAGITETNPIGSDGEVRAAELKQAAAGHGERKSKAGQRRSERETCSKLEQASTTK
jgi:hypothetical protein